MADVYVSSNGDNTTGVDEATAFTAHTGATVTTGDQVLFEQTQAETPGATNITWTGTHLSPVRVASVDYNTSETGEYDPGASIQPTGTNDLTLSGDSIMWQGMTLKGGDDLIINGDDQEVLFTDCILGSTSTGAGHDILIGNVAAGATFTMVNCTYAFGNAAGSFDISAALDLDMYGGAFSSSQTDFLVFNSAERIVRVYAAGVDFSNVTNLVNVGTTLSIQAVRITFDQCALNSSYNLISGDMDDYSYSARIEAILSDGTDSAGRAAPFQYEHEERGGSSISVTTHHISGPTALDGDFWSQKVTAYGGNTVKGNIQTSSQYTLRKSYKGALGSPVTATVRFAHDAVAWGSGTSGRLQTDEIMFTFRGPDDTASQSSQAPYQLSATPSFHPLGIIEPGNAVAAADHTDDTTSTWTATTPTLSDQQDKQEFSYTWTPEVEGEVEIVCYVTSGDGSVDRDVYISPDIEFS